MEEKNATQQKRVLARVLADELDNVEGGMPAQYTYVGTNDYAHTDVDSYGIYDTDQL